MPDVEGVWFELVRNVCFFSSILSHVLGLRVYALLGLLSSSFHVSYDVSTPLRSPPPLLSTLF